MAKQENSENRRQSAACQMCGGYRPAYWMGEEVECPCCGNICRRGWTKPVCGTCYNVARRVRRRFDVFVRCAVGLMLIGLARLIFEVVRLIN